MKRLFRIPADGKIAGVCAGIAHYFDADVTLVRLAWIILSIVPGALIGGVAAYVAAWLIMPAVWTPVPATARRRLTRSETDRRLGGVCGGLADYTGVDSTAVRVAVIILAVYPGVIVFGILAYLITWFVIPPPPVVTIAGVASPA